AHRVETAARIGGPAAKVHRAENEERIGALAVEARRAESAARICGPAAADRPEGQGISTAEPRAPGGPRPPLPAPATEPIGRASKALRVGARSGTDADRAAVRDPAGVTSPAADPPLRRRRSS